MVCRAKSLRLFAGIKAASFCHSPNSAQVHSSFFKEVEITIRFEVDKNIRILTAFYYL